MNNKNDGQQAIPEIMLNRAGMPPFDLIRTEVARMGLSQEDADSVIDHWLANGFRTGRHKVQDWKAVLRIWKREQWFPSQKKGLKDRTSRTDWSKY